MFKENNLLFWIGEPFDKPPHDRSHKDKHTLKKEQEIELQASNSSIIDINLLKTNYCEASLFPPAPKDIDS